MQTCYRPTPSYDLSSGCIHTSAQSTIFFFSVTSWTSLETTIYNDQTWKIMDYIHKWCDTINVEGEKSNSKKICNIKHKKYWPSEQHVEVSSSSFFLRFLYSTHFVQILFELYPDDICFISETCGSCIFFFSNFFYKEVCSFESCVDNPYNLFCMNLSESQYMFIKLTASD